MNMQVHQETAHPTISTSEMAAVLSMVARAAADPNVDIDKLERLMQMQERAIARQSEQGFNAALNRAQASMGRVKANQTNSQTHSNYADYAALDRALRPIYTEEGFSLSFDTGSESTEGCIRVLCHVSHSEGHTRTYQADMPVDGKGAKGNDVMTKTHATGSGMSYGMRYLLKMIFNVAIGETDDDGNAASRVTDAQDAKADEFLQAIAEAETVATLRDNVGNTIAASGLPGVLLKKVRATYTARLTKLREAEQPK